MIDDTEPEDLYDASDPLPIRLAIIVGIANAAGADLDVVRARRRAVLIARLLHDIVTELGEP